MTSIQDQDGAFAPLKQLPHWSQLQRRDSGVPLDSPRASSAHYDPPRPIEPGESRNFNHNYPTNRSREDAAMPHRQQLPGVHELLSPSVRTGARSPASGEWVPINNPPNWRDRLLSTTSTQSNHIPHAPPAALHAVHPSAYHRQTEHPLASPYRHNSVHLPPGSSLQPSLPMPALSLRHSDFPSPRSLGSQEHSQRGGDYFQSPYQTMSTIPGRDTLAEQMLDRRSSSTFLGKSNAAGGILNLQIVGQRDIPGEGLCYVFKDGSTCPTIIDGEPVNPLWGTTKAGKARKRLAQACLNCREKKIKCEPGETSCLQCEKAKRECLRPLAQSQAEMATGAALSTSHTSPECDWRTQTSPRSTSTGDIPPPKRRRSAHVAQQESAFSGSVLGINTPGSEVKRCRSNDVAPLPTPEMERLRKDSKRPFVDEQEHELATTLSGKPDVMAQCEDPYQIEPGGTVRFLDLFFAQSAREVHLMFPRKSFTRWVKTCRTKSQGECMVLNALLAVGSLSSNNEFTSFSRVCIKRATEAARNLFGQFSLALVQARLLLGIYHHSTGNDSLAWDYNGSALQAVGAMKLNLEEGCGDNLEEHTRPCYGFSVEQLRECRRRTFWATFLMDRYNGFCSGLITTVHEDDVHLRLPCREQIYEEGSCSTAPLFGSINIGPSSAAHPAAFILTVSVLWKEVVQFIYRSERYPASVYAARYETFLSNIHQKLSDWTVQLPGDLKYSRENMERAIAYDYAGDFVSMHTLYLLSHLRIARMVRYELITAPLVARSICTAHSHALQLLALVRDVRILTLSSRGVQHRTTDFMSPFIAYAITSAIDTVGAGGLREEIVATMQVMSTATELISEFSQYCSSAQTQARMAEKRLAQMDSWPSELDIRSGKGTDGRCWRLAEPMEKTSSLRQDVMYGVLPCTFSDAITQGRKR